MKYTLLVVCLSFGFIHLSLADGSDVAQRQEYELRFVFPFYPKELDILIGHLQTKVRATERDTQTGIVRGAIDTTVKPFDSDDADDDNKMEQNKDTDNSSDVSYEKLDVPSGDASDEKLDVSAGDVSDEKLDVPSGDVLDEKLDVSAGDVSDEKLDVSAGDVSDEKQDGYEIFRKHLRYLQFELYRVQQSLESCEAINTGNHEAGSNVISINDKGDVSDPPEGRVDKLKVITTLREEIRAAEAKLEICRFHFWTGKSKGESAK